MLSPLHINDAILYDAQHRCWLHFSEPVHICTTACLADVVATLDRVQQWVDQYRGYAVGFVSYEASPACDASLVVQPCDDFPLVWFGLYTSPHVVELPQRHEPAIALDWQPSISRDQYREAIHTIKHHIAHGHTYQVNFSLRLRSKFTANSWPYFLQLMQAQEGLYGAFINLEHWTICCASPELFFQLNDDTLTCRPMKGTAPRGLMDESDRQSAITLRHSSKNQAENVMIVDMIRNDLGRIAKTGSVQVPHLFDVEQYPTLWQMTSPVECQTTASFADIFQALFPCASITGAPKPRTMQIIADLEDSPRRLYTGTIGLLKPDRQAQFNVAIRTVLINKAQQVAEYGVGGGIVWDSEETSEYEECCTKAQILVRQQPAFELLESILWTPATDFFLLEFHLQRLQQSARFFAFYMNGDEVRDRLYQQVTTFSDQSYKVRVQLAKQGDLTITAAAISPRSTPWRVSIAQTAIDANNLFLYHKTTHRVIYEQMQQAHPGYDDVLLWNQHGEVTESCLANVVVEWHGQWYTPPLQCGLLAGTFRRWLLEQGKVQERVIRVEDLFHCSRIFLVNSIRQIQEVTVDLPEAHLL